MTKQLLKEELNVYIDDDTGNEYVYDGTKLILIKQGDKKGRGIGSKGDEEIQAQEEAQRNLEAAEDGVLEDKEELEARIKKIEDALNDEETAREIQRETNSRATKNELRAELNRSKKELEQFRNDPIVKFEGSLNHFIRKQIKLVQDYSYKKLNKKYDGTGLLRKGLRRYEDEKKPSVKVYFDRSGSWDEEKTKVGRQAIATLEKYRRAGKIDLTISYFNDKVFNNYTERGSGGTYGTPILADILAKKPDNVIIMTDSDITDCREHVEVPGVVWYLFKGGKSQNLIDHLRGKVATEVFEI